MATSLAAFGACQKVPLVAPSGTAITLVADANVLAVDGSVNVTAVLIEGSAASTGSGSTASSSTTEGGGAPVHNGTLVTFTTTLGHLEPSEARTDEGRATVKLSGDGRSGVATITAFSGAATKTLTVNIGAAAASHISMTATPQSLPGTGGSATVSAHVEDAQGNGLSGIPVSFSTTAGTLTPTSAISNDQGYATTTLTTIANATVTATTGGASAATTGTVDVTLKPRTAVSFSTVPASAVVAVPVVFGLTPGTGAILTNVVVDFGDGSSASLGGITGATNIAHVFRSVGVKTVTATATDSQGGTGSVSTQIAVAPLALTLASTPDNPIVGTTVTFTVTPSTGALIDHYDWNFGDGSTGTSTGTQVTHAYGSAAVFPVSVTATPSGGGTPAQQLLSISIGH